MGGDLAWERAARDDDGCRVVAGSGADGARIISCLESAMRLARVIPAVVVSIVACLALWGLPTSTRLAAQPLAGADASADLSASIGRALDAMAKEAVTREMKGVAVIAFVPGDTTQGWSSQMRVVDSFVLGQANVLGIAYAKMSEMADTLKDSGSGVRPPHHGELGYKGGAIRKIPGGFVLAAFSGGKDTDDLAVANLGLDALGAHAQ